LLTMDNAVSNEEAMHMLIDKLLGSGRNTKPRGLSTLEFPEPIGFTVEDPRKRLITYRHTGSNPIYPYIEGLWMLLGEEDTKRLVNYSKFPTRFINPNTGLMDGAYGPRIRDAYPRLVHGNEQNRLEENIDQLETVYRRLKKDRDSRRAIINIGSVNWDWDDTCLDIPCTQTWQFMIRDDKLDMVTTMRSQDLIKGLPNDLCEFQWFQEIIAGWLGVEVGKYTHFVGCLHAYQSDMKYAIESLENESSYRLYNIVKPLDARVSKEDFATYLRNLEGIERCAVINPEKTHIEMLKVKEELDKWNEFYRRLATTILANRYYKIGYIDDAIGLVKDKKTDLEYYYYNRWNQ
jgi:thymidylate synthase